MIPNEKTVVRPLRFRRGTRTSAARWGARLLALVLVGPAIVSATEVPKVQRLDIVDKSIVFHGGEIFSESATTLELCSKSGCYGVSTVVDKGLFDYVVTGRIRGVERKVRATNESVELWEDGSPVVVPVDQETRLRDWAVARIYFCFLPFRLNDDSVFKQDLGLEMWEGRPLHKVKVTFSPGSSTDAEDEYMYWFDPQSGRVEQFAYSFTGNPGGLRFRQPFNYRRVGGVLFFDQENLGVEGTDLTVDDLTPETVGTMRQVSTVQLRTIQVRPLD